MVRELYKSFPDNKNEKLSGKVSLKPDEYEHCNVDGEVKFKVHLNCTRCTKPLSHTIDSNFSMLFRPAKYDMGSQEVELSSEELEANYMSENDEIDVSQVVLDFINDETPDVLHCEKCSNKKIDGPVYKSSNDEKLNPFAKLKDLKLSD